MTELSLLKTLMDKEFYELHKGIRCPNEIFTKDVRKVKKVLDYAMEKYDRSISLVDLESLFYTSNKTLTTSNKEQYQKIFQKIANTNALNKDVASDVISKLFQQVVGEEVANIGYAFVNGTQNSLEPLRKIVEDYQDDFTPNLKIEFEDMSIEDISDKDKIRDDIATDSKVSIYTHLYQQSNKKILGNRYNVSKGSIENIINFYLHETSTNNQTIQ